MFPVLICTNNCMFTVTIVHIDYSGNLQYMQSGSNKYILIESYRTYLLYAISQHYLRI